MILSKPTWLLGTTIEGGAACWGDIGAAMLEGAQGTIAKFQKGEMRMLNWVVLLKYISYVKD